MACFHPLDAWRTDYGKIVFSDNGSGRHLKIPCGRCIGCRQVRQRSWALRCIHESKMHESNCFLTLTYDDAHFNPSLNYSDFQGFMHRLRAEVRRESSSKVRFFACGEYGSVNWRPHFHACVFGFRPADGVRCGKRIFRSKLLERLWPFGFSSFGEVGYDSAAYVAGYCLKKVVGKRAASHYERCDWESGEIYSLVPEFARMSLKPGLGFSWFQKYWRDVYGARDGVPMPGGRVVPAPRYYDNLLARLEPGLISDKEVGRFEHAAEFVGECEPDRLAVREACAIARHKLKERFL